MSCSFAATYASRRVAKEAGRIIGHCGQDGSGAMCAMAVRNVDLDLKAWGGRYRGNDGAARCMLYETGLGGI